MAQIYNLQVLHVDSLPVHQLHGVSRSAQVSTRLQVSNFRGVFIFDEKLVLTVLGVVPVGWTLRCFGISIHDLSVSMDGRLHRHAENIVIPHFRIYPCLYVLILKGATGRDQLCRWRVSS